MYNCEVCHTRHSESPEVCRQTRDQYIQGELSRCFERIYKQYGYTPEIRLKIANYTLGYTGASYGLHVE